MKIKDLSKVDMPREKLEKYGEQKLKEHELLAIILGSGIKGTNVLELSKKIIRTIRQSKDTTPTLKELQEIKGLGKAKASQIIAILTLTKRFAEPPKETVLSAEDVWKLCIDIRDSKREHFVAFYLDTQNQLLERQIISIGTLNASLVHPREVFEPALRMHAASLIVAHNHPSGSLEPSKEDREVTKRLKDAGELLGIELVDHVIVTKLEHFSFLHNQLL